MKTIAARMMDSKKAGLPCPPLHQTKCELKQTALQTIVHSTGQDNDHRFLTVCDLAHVMAQRVNIIERSNDKLVP